jgi:hypothetical protein
MQVTDRFWAKVQKGDGCWEWSAGRLPVGYGRFRVSPEREALAHRYSYELNVGPVPDGLCVLHRCDNPSCVRPDHLFVGTHKDNTQDMFGKDRHGKQFRQRTHCKRGHPLTPENVTAWKNRRKCLPCQRIRANARYHATKHMVRCK